ncbi:hypothetical protein JTE90_018435 [Oedothorax gibbosus]|uniref:Uncharacterized protein n=1 Tax=Oedothorax gibbosus TaxID=931172 RepID=A0AAV6UXW2_9ARAC|nr:hypothetical protein JTE90_018435 [Oedothorax gibbosus]
MVKLLVTPVVSLAAILVFINVNIQAEEQENKLLCNDKLMQKIDHVVTNIPEHVTQEILKCVQESQSDLETNEITVTCDTEVKKIPALYDNIIQYTFLFAQCGSSVVEEMKDTLSPSEKEKAASLENEGMQIFDIISELY